MVVRPFGVLGGRYRVQGLGLAAFIGSWSVALVFLAYLILKPLLSAAAFSPADPVDLTVFAVATAFAGALAVTSARLGERIERDE